MKDKIECFRQHTGMTCGISCCLMLLQYYERDLQYPTVKMEHNLYSHYRVNGYKGVTGAAIANCLSKNNLEVHLVQSFADRMENRGFLFSEADHEKIVESHLAHLKACKARIHFSAGMDFDCDFLAQNLIAGRKIVLECLVPETPDGPPSVLHWWLLDSYENGLFRILDSIRHREPRYLSAEELASYMDTPVGKICIIVGEPNDQLTL